MTDADLKRAVLREALAELRARRRERERRISDERLWDALTRRGYVVARPGDRRR